MPVTVCPHCEEGIDSLTRTGEKKYSCGKCNMVIKYDDIRDDLDEFEVIDKRDNGGGGSGGSSEDPSQALSDVPPPPDPNNGGNTQQNQQQSQQQSQQQGMNHQISEREKIYQRGTDGLREIKKQRLKDWLSSTEGVGAQTEQRIMMVFERNESIHSNPHVLYNLLDDEVGASASYLNTMVQDIFQPEQEYSDLLQSQGYTPFHQRNNGGGNVQQQNMGQGGPMNATGSQQFSPNQQGGGGNQQQPRQPQQGQQGNQQQGDMGDDSLSREEAEVMMRQAVTQANSQQERNALMNGLSEGANEAIKNAASNIGGLAQTAQKVIDEALVEKARQDPDWVIENIDILQNLVGADASGDTNTEPKQSEEDRKVDDALENLGGGNQGNRQQQQHNQGQRQQPANDQSQQSRQSEQTQTQPQDTEPSEPNPDIDEEKLMGDSGFEYDTQNFGQEQQEQQEQEHNISEPDQAQESEMNTQSTENTEDNSGSEGFDEIFGDMAEE